MIKKCAICEAEFEAVGKGSNKRKSCSTECSKENLRRWHKINYKSKAKPSTTRHCKICNQPFEATGRKSAKQVTCSKACSKENERRTDWQRRFRLRPKKTCVVCGMEFPRSRALTCSANCSKELARKREGKRSPRTEWARKYREANFDRIKVRARHWNAANRKHLNELQRNYQTRLSAAMVIVKDMIACERMDKNPAMKRNRNREVDPNHYRKQYAKRRAKYAEKMREYAVNYYAKRTAALRIVKKLQQGIMP